MYNERNSLTWNMKKTQMGCDAGTHSIRCNNLLTAFYIIFIPIYYIYVTYHR